jgi:hypothetical protein
MKKQRLIVLLTLLIAATAVFSGCEKAAEYENSTTESSIAETEWIVLPNGAKYAFVETAETGQTLLGSLAIPSVSQLEGCAAVVSGIVTAKRGVAVSYVAYDCERTDYYTLITFEVSKQYFSTDGELTEKTVEFLSPENSREDYEYKLDPPVGTEMIVFLTHPSGNAVTVCGLDKISNYHTTMAVTFCLPLENGLCQAGLFMACADYIGLEDGGEEFDINAKYPVAVVEAKIAELIEKYMKAK